ncbi:hypothetical protein ACS0TY_001216 [Phlomoides rotata]
MEATATMDGESVEIDGYDVDCESEVLILKLGNLGTCEINKQTPINWGGHIHLLCASNYKLALFRYSAPEEELWQLGNEYFSIEGLMLRSVFVKALPGVCVVCTPIIDGKEEDEAGEGKKEEDGAVDKREEEDESENGGLSYVRKGEHTRRKKHHREYNKKELHLVTYLPGWGQWAIIKAHGLEQPLMV